MKTIAILFICCFGRISFSAEISGEAIFHLVINKGENKFYYILNDKRLAQVIETQYLNSKNLYPKLDYISENTRNLYLRAFRNALIDDLNTAQNKNLACFLSEELVRQFLNSFRDAGILSEKGINQRQTQIVKSYSAETCEDKPLNDVDLLLSSEERERFLEAEIEFNDRGIRYLSIESQKELFHLKRASIVGTLYLNRYEDLSQAHPFQDLFATNQHRAGAKIDFNLALVKALSYRLSFSLYHEGDDNDGEAGEWLGRISNNISYSPHKYLRFSLSYEVEKSLSPKSQVESQWKIMGSYVPKIWR
jgi:hypothetical protein